MSPPRKILLSEMEPPERTRSIPWVLKEGSAMKRSVRSAGLLVTAVSSNRSRGPRSLVAGRGRVSAQLRHRGYTRVVRPASLSSRGHVPPPAERLPIKSYVVTSHPLGRTCVSKTTACAVTHLKPGASYCLHRRRAQRAGHQCQFRAVERCADPERGQVTISPRSRSLNDAVATDFVAIDNAIEANPDASLTKDLKQLSGAYAAFTSR